MFTARRLRPILLPVVLRFALPFVLALWGPSVALPSPLQTHLDRQTSIEYSTYVTGVEQDITRRWKGTGNVVEAEQSPELLAKVKSGSIVVHPSTAKSPVPVYDGLVHDWTGDVFIPDTTIEQVIDL